MSTPDFLQPGYVFCQPCRYCSARIEFTAGNAPADFFCSDKCREASNSARVKQIRETFEADLLKFLADHEAVIELQAYNDGSAGCEVKVAGEVVATFDGQIGELKKS